MRCNENGIVSKQCVRLRLACSVGDSPTGGRVQEPFVAWVASVEETKRMKPTDKAIFGMVSESPGRNVREQWCTIAPSRWQLARESRGGPKGQRAGPGVDADLS
jgi:hypothetical protein